MTEFRVVVSDVKTGKAYQIPVSGPQANKFIGKSINDTVGGDALNLAGYSIKITGGTDKDGFPMRDDLPGPKRRKILVAGGVGYHPKHDGMRKRKSMRGREISEDILQINAIIAEYGPKPLSEIFEKKAEGEKKAETPVEKKE